MSCSGMAKGMDVIGNRHDTSTYCHECEASGHTHLTIPKETLTHSHDVLGHVFSDVCEVQTITREGYQYFITFVDDHSRFLTIHLMKKKSDALEAFKDFLMEAECQSGKKLKVLHTDGGGEYFSTKFIQYLKNSGIVHEKTNPDTPQENGMAECVNRTLVTMSIAMLESTKSKIGCTAWPYALRHATLIKNIVPHSSLPDGVSPDKHRDKLSSHSMTGIHLGLAVGKKAFVIYNPVTNRVHETHDVHFFEGMPESEQVMIEVPGVDSPSHVVEEGSDGGNGDNDAEASCEGVHGEAEGG